MRLGDLYENRKKIGEGTYGVVYKATQKGTNKTVALKMIECDRDGQGVPQACIREVATLRQLKHDNIVPLYEEISLRREGASIVTKMYLVFEFMDQDLKQLLRKQPGKCLPVERVKNFSFQLLQALKYIHTHRFVHRDLKPENILVSNAGVVKLADFGLARQITLPSRPYTHEIVTLNYRPPEILVGQKFYTSGVDIWSFACIFAEMATGKILFEGDSEIDQLFKIFKILGTPTSETWPGLESGIDYDWNPTFRQSFPLWPKWKGGREELRRAIGGKLDDDGIDLIYSMLAYAEGRRISASEALSHPRTRLAHPYLRGTLMHLEPLDAIAERVSKLKLDDKRKEKVELYDTDLFFDEQPLDAADDGAAAAAGTNDGHWAEQPEELPDADDAAAAVKDEGQRKEPVARKSKEAVVRGGKNLFGNSPHPASKNAAAAGERRRLNMFNAEQLQPASREKARMPRNLFGNATEEERANFLQSQRAAMDAAAAAGVRRPPEEFLKEMRQLLCDDAPTAAVKDERPQKELVAHKSKGAVVGRGKNPVGSASKVVQPPQPAAKNAAVAKDERQRKEPVAQSSGVKVEGRGRDLFGSAIKDELPPAAKDATAAENVDDESVVDQGMKLDEMGLHEQLMDEDQQPQPAAEDATAAAGRSSLRRSRAASGGLRQQSKKKMVESEEESDEDDEPSEKRGRKGSVGRKDKAVPQKRRSSSKGTSQSRAMKMDKEEEEDSDKEKNELDCPECEFQSTSVRAWFEHIMRQHSTTPILAGYLLRCDCGDESYSYSHSRECEMSNFTIIHNGNGPIRRLTDPVATPQCLFCETNPTTPRGYCNHLKIRHKTTPKASGIYLICSCGMRYNSHNDQPKHDKKCNGLNFTLHMLDEPTTPQCVLCEMYPKTPYGYTFHLKSHHETTLRKEGIFLMCACGMRFSSENVQKTHDMNKCTGRDFTLHSLVKEDEEDDEIDFQKDSKKSEMKEKMGEDGDDSEELDTDDI